MGSYGQDSCQTLKTQMAVRAFNYVQIRKQEALSGDRCTGSAVNSRTVSESVCLLEERGSSVSVLRCHYSSGCQDRKLILTCPRSVSASVNASNHPTTSKNLCLLCSLIPGPRFVERKAEDPSAVRLSYRTRGVVKDSHTARSNNRSTRFS